MELCKSLVEWTISIYQDCLSINWNKLYKAGNIMPGTKEELNKCYFIPLSSLLHLLYLFFFLEIFTNTCNFYLPSWPLLKSPFLLKIVSSPIPNLLLRLISISDSGSLIMETVFPELFISLFLFVRNVLDFLDLPIPQIKCHLCS